MPFIVSTGLHKTDQDTRKFIRKHVMLGKNTGKGSGKQRHNKAKRKRPLPEFIPLAIAPRPDEDIPTFSDTLHTLSSAYPPSIPQKIGTDLSLVQFADVVEPSTASLVLRCKYCFSLFAKISVQLGELNASSIKSSLSCGKTNIISPGIMYFVRQTRRATMD